MPWPSINPGDLRHRITFLAPVTASTTGGMSVTYQAEVPPRRARAKIEIVNGTDIIKSGQDISQVIARVTIRYRSDVQPDMQFQTDRGGTWVIRAIENVEDRNRLLVMTCLGLGLNN